MIVKLNLKRFTFPAQAAVLGGEMSEKTPIPL